MKRGQRLDERVVAEGLAETRSRAEALIRAAPEEIIGAAPAMVSALLHAHPATPDPEPLGAARKKALAAMCAIVPGLAGPALAFEAFASGRCDAGQKLEVLDAVDRVTNQTISRKMEPRRAGDPAELVSDPARIRATLPWQPQYADLGQIITHALQWERKLAELREE